MHPKFFGDSYDHVKRTLLSIRPNRRLFVSVPMLTEHANESFFECYERFLSCQVLSSQRNALQPKQRASWLSNLCEVLSRSAENVFLDPDTGIRPIARMKATKLTHLSTDEICEIARSIDKNSLLLCFDQSLSRGSEDEARAEKLAEIKGKKVHAIYFRSHASILVATRSRSLLNKWCECANKMGIVEGNPGLQYLQSE